MRIFLIIFLISTITLPLSAQASLAVLGTPYTENFNSLPNVTDGSPMAGWANNTSLTGWYMNLTPTIEATYLTMQNAGGNYIYALGTDRNIGSRASNITGACYYGVRLVNNTGVALTSIYVDYFGEQWTIAENGVAVNATTFDYQVGPTVTTLTAGAWTNVPALTFTQLYTSSQSAGLGGTACGGNSSQCLALNGNLAANRIEIQACITVAIPAGNEIMLRWVDANDANNDHHLQIDDVSVWPFNISCLTILPVELLDFSGKQIENHIKLDWSTASENNNRDFTVERFGNDGEFETIGVIPGNGNSISTNFYSFIDENPHSGNNYYRLIQTDINGQSKTYNPIAVLFNDENNSAIAKSWKCEDGFCYDLSGWNSPVEITVFDVTGRIIQSIEATDESQGKLIFSQPMEGIFILRFSNKDKQVIQKLVY